MENTLSAGFGEVATSLAKAGRVEELVRLYETRAQEVPSAEEAAHLLVQAGQLVFSQLKNANRAESLYRRALDYAPTSREALQGLFVLAETRKDVPQQAELLERLARTEKGSEAADLLFRAGQLYEKKLGWTFRATLCYQRQTVVDSRSRSGYAHARQLLMAEARLTAVWESLERERAVFGDRALIDAYLTFAEALVLSPKSHGLAQLALERVFAVDEKNARANAVEEEIESLPNTWRERAKQLRTQSMSTDDKREAARLGVRLTRLVAHYDKLTMAKAKDALDRTFVLWPAMPEALNLLEELGAQESSPESIISLFSLLAEETNDKEAQVDLHLRIGQIYLAKLANAAEATNSFETAARIDPSRSDAVNLAMEGLIEAQLPDRALALLEAYGATLTEAGDKLNHALLLADLTVRLKRDSYQTKKYLLEAAQLAPDNALVAFRLARLEVEEGDADLVWSRLQLAVSAPVPVGDRAALCELVALLCEEEGATDKAFQALAWALPLEPHKVAHLTALEDAAQRANKPDEFIATIRRALQATQGQGVNHLWRALGQALEAKGRLAEARNAWEELLKHEAGDEQAQQSLLQIDSTLKAGEVNDPRSRLEEEARRLESTANDPAATLEVYRQILVLEPDNVAVLKKFGATAASLGHWEEVATVSAQLMASAELPSERREWRARLAQLYAERLGRQEEAVGLYLNLVEEGFHAAPVINGLERLASSGVRRLEIARALAKVHAKSGESQRQVASLLVLLESPASQDEEKALLLMLAEVTEHRLLEPRAAFNFVLRGLKVSPDDSTLNHEAMRLARMLNTQVELSEHFMSLARAETDSARSLALWLAATQAADSSRAGIEVLKKALEHRPDDAVLLARLGQAYESEGLLDEAERVLRLQWQSASKDRKVSFALELSQMNAELERPTEAAAMMREALAAGADKATYLPRLSSLLEAAGDLHAVEVVQTEWIEALEQSGRFDEAQVAKVKRAKLIENVLGDKPQAIQKYAEALSHNPADGEATQALENLLADDVHRKAAAEALLVVARRNNDFRRQVSLLTAMAESSRDTREKITNLQQAASIYSTHLKQPELAFAMYASVLRLAPGDTQFVDRARLASEEADAADVYGDLLEELAEKGGESTVMLRGRLAQLAEKKLNDHERAITQWKLVLSAQPDNTEALAALQRLYRHQEQFDSLVEVLTLSASLEKDITRKTELEREGAAIAEHALDQPERAAMLWQRVVERDPYAKDAAAHLDRLASGLDDVKAQVLAIEARRKQEGLSPAGRDLTFRLAELKAARLQDNNGALELIKSILAEDPQHAKSQELLLQWVKAGEANAASALAILDNVYVRNGEHGLRIALREARLSGMTSLEERQRLSAEIRAILEREMNQPEAAFMSALKAFTDGIDREGVRSELERLAEVTEAQDELAEIYETVGDELTADDADQTALWSRAAQLREQRSQPDDSIRLWNKVIAQRPQDTQALEGLSRLYASAQNARSLSEVYVRRAQLSSDAAERFQLLLQAAQSFEAAGEEDAAIEALRNAAALKQTPEVYVALDRLFAKTKMTREQLDALNVLATLTDDPPSRLSLLDKRAHLLEKLGLFGDSLQHYREALSIDEKSALAVAGVERLLAHDSVKQDAALMLEPVYRQGNELKKLGDVLDIRLEVSEPADRLALLSELSVLREALGQKSVALTHRLRAFSEEPGNRQARSELEHLAFELGAFEELTSGYEDVLDRGVEQPLAVELHRRLASIYAERMARDDLAAEHFEAVLKQVPDDRVALAALAGTYQRTADYRALFSVRQKALALEDNAQTRIEMLSELALMAEERLSDKALAADCYQHILTQKPDDISASRALGRLLSETERYPELAQRLALDIVNAHQRGAKEEAWELKVKLGRLRQARLGDARGALTTFEEVLREKPGHAGAVGAIEEMASSDSPLKGEAAIILEPVFESHGDHAKTVQMLEARCAAEPDPKRRSDLLRRMSALYLKQLGNPEMAFVSAARAFRERPEEPENLKLALSTYGDADAEDEMIDLLTEVGPRTADDQSRLQVYRALAQLSTKGQHPSAVDSWKRVLELSPTDSEALQNLADILGRSERLPELLEVLRRQLTIEEEPGRRADLLLQMGILQQNGLRDSAGAMTTFRRVLDLRNDDQEALRRMDSLCEAEQRWPELADILIRRLRVEAAEDCDDLKLKLALIRETKLLDKTGAIELYTELLASNSRNGSAMQRLEAIVQREPQNLPSVDALIAAYRLNRDTGKLTRLLESRAAVTQDQIERKSHLQELARLRDAEGEPELAYLATYRAYKEDPNDAELRRQLEHYAEVAQSYDELASAYESELHRIDDTATAASIHLTLAQLFESRLNEPEKAAEYYEKARTIDASLSAQVLAPLDRLYGQLKRPREQADILEIASMTSTDANEKQALLFRLGQLYGGQLALPDQAANAFERVLAIDPKHGPSLRSLELLYEDGKRDEKLFQNLERQLEAASGPERERVLSKMAMVSAEGLGNVDQSVQMYRQLLEKNNRNDQAFQSLSALLDKTQRYDELKGLLESRLAVTIDPREIVRLNEKLGHLIFERLGQPEAAIAPFKSALERDPRHRGALEALRDIYGQLDRREDLIVVLKKLIPLQDDSAGVKQVRIRLAEEVAMTQRREEALDTARRALEIEPHEVADLDRLYAVCAQLKAWPDAIKALEAKATQLVYADDKEAAIATLFEVSQLWQTTAQKPENAGVPLERVLDIEPSNRKAYEAALAAYSKLNDWRGYARVTERFLPQVVTDAEKLATLQELARVQEQKLGLKDMAFLSICRALQLDPSVPHIQETAVRLAEETQSFEELAAVFEEVADAQPKGPLSEQMYMTLAQVQDQRLDDPAAAEEALRKVLEFDPTNQNALTQLSAMFSRRGKNKEYVVSLEQQLEASGSLEQRKDLLREMARVYDSVLGNQFEAENALVRALELEPDMQLLTTLADLQRRQENYVTLSNTLLRMRDIAKTPEERARFQVEAAQVQERELGDAAAAIDAYRLALEFDPANAVALEALERLYTKADRPAELLSVYERQLEVTTDYRERVRVLFKSANIWEERYQNLAHADSCIEAALQVDPQNLQALKTLERLRRLQGRWEELIGVVDRHIQLLTRAEEKAELCVELGDTFHQQLRAVDRAVGAYHQALELDPTCRPAMHALGTLYERSGNWPSALEMLEREARALGPSSEAVDLYFRMGKINEDMLIDTHSAKRAFLESLRIDSSYVPSIRALKGIYEIEKDWENYEKALNEESRQTTDPLEKAQALRNAAAYYESKDNQRLAIVNYEESLKLFPTAIESARPLADIYLSSEQFLRCEEMLDIVTDQLSAAYAKRPDDGDLTRELCRRYYRLGYVCEKNSKRDKALLAYEKAYQLDSTYLAVLEAYGNLLVQAERFDDALKVYQSILLHHRGDLTDLEVAEIYWTLGDLHSRLSQLDRAENHFEKALQVDGSHEPSLRSMAQVAESRGAWDKAAEAKQKLLHVVQGEARFEIGLSLGRLAKEKLNDPYIAIDAYLAAHRAEPGNIEVMDNLYVLYSESKQGARAAEMLERMLGQEVVKNDAQRAKRVWFALGEISRDQLNDIDKALMCFNQALDAEWKFIEAFSAIEAMLGRAARWKQLDENYKRMLARFPKTPDTHVARMTLWKALGDLYLNVLKSPEAAVEVYKVVAAGLPDDAEIQEQFATLAQTQNGYESQAAEAWMRALPQTANPTKVASALAELAARRKDYDGAWLAAQVVSGLLGDLGPSEKEILLKLTPYAKKREVASRQVTDRLWQQHLFHPKLRGPLSELLGLLFDQAGTLYREEFAKYGVNPKKHQIDVAQAQEYQVHHFRYVSRVLGMEHVPLFSPYLTVTRERLAKRTSELAPDAGVTIEAMHAEPMALKVGGKFFAETGQKEVYYQLGRAFALLRPEVALCARLSAERLEAVLQAAISMSVDRFRFTADVRAIDTERKALERQLSQKARTALARIVGQYVQVATPNDLRLYLEGIELSASRTGAFVAGEIDAVKKLILSETGAAYRVQPRSKIRDLMVFALGDDWRALRTAVGTNIEVQVRK
jgi:golgin subfamily B member 1